MKTLLFALVVLSVGCGFPLTPGAVSCGSVLGVSVYVDGGGKTCDVALGEVTKARDLGASAGLWDANQTFEGQRLEFVGTRDLSSEGFGVANGETEGADMAVVYYFDSAQDWTDPLPSTVILVHEFTHVVHPGGGHCAWAGLYAPKYAAFGQTQFFSIFTDECAGVRCHGSACTPVSK